METKIMWKAWDEFLVDAWKKDRGMFITTWQFLMSYGVSQVMLKAMEPKDFFANIGVTSRSPKVRNHLFCPVKAFFWQFFPVANELLWQGKKLEALRAMRRYYVGEEQMRVDREMRQSKKKARKVKSTSGLPLISGTNAMHIYEARRAASDWGTVKPSRCRQRTRRL